MDHTSFKHPALITEEAHEWADGLIRRAHPILSALLLGLALAQTGMGPWSMAQAQTARAEGQIGALKVASTSLRAQYASIVRQSGKVLVFGQDGSANAITERWGRFVLYAPLNRLWLLDDETDGIVEHASIDVKHKPFEHLVLNWMHSLDDDISDILPAAAQLPMFTVESTTPHPLATQYDALLSKPLAQPIDPLPAGAYFSAAGHVFDAAGAQIADWDSYGADILLRLIPVTTAADETKVETPTPDADPVLPPVWQWLAVADLKAALTPKQPFEQGDQ